MLNLFKSVCSPKCDIFFERSSRRQRNLPTCNELIGNIFPKTFYQLQETLFDKLLAFDIQIAKDKFSFYDFAGFQFESICVKTSLLIDTETTTWVGNCEPISASISSNLLGQSVFICDSEPHSLVSVFVTSLERYAEESISEMNFFHEIATTTKKKIECAISTNNKRSRHISSVISNERQSVVEANDDYGEEITAST